MTKDELRVERSIHSLLRKCDAALERMRPRSYEKEKQFENWCFANGILYSPNKMY